MHKVMYIMAGIAVVVGAGLLMHTQKPGPAPAVAATKLSTNTTLAETHPQYAVMAELIPVFTAVHRVQVLNLVNGLWLTDEQLDEMIGYLSEKQRLENRYLDVLPRIQAHKADFDNCCSLLGEVQEVLVTAGQPNPGLSSSAESAVTDLMMVFGDFDTLENDLNEFNAEAQAGIYNLLTENQKVLLQDYVECIIPPVGDPNNPERIGQASGEAHQHMVELRALSEEEYAHAKDHIVNEIWSFVIKHFPDEQQGATAEKQRIGDALDSVRAMSDKDFAMGGEDVFKLVVPYELHPRAEVPAGCTYNEEVVRARIHKFFIENNPVDVLREYRDNRNP